MERRAFLTTGLGLTATALAGRPLAALAQGGPDTKWRAFEVTTRAEIVNPAGPVRAWIPLPLAPDTDYSVHVHDLPCTGEAGGAHYLLDPAVTEVTEANEIWLTLASDAAGAASDSVWVDHLARGEARSLVIHDPADGGRLACVDLD